LEVQQRLEYIFYSVERVGARYNLSVRQQPKGQNQQYYVFSGVGIMNINPKGLYNGQWYKLRIDVNNAGNSVGFYIDGNLVATITSNIPATTTAMSIGSYIVKTVGINSRQMQTDYFMYEEIFTNPR
jgi:hypothetical protein